ncbi:hypothetical protein Y032_0010g862 [Ancylostoma ceylanicum]|uniref:Uncharacterized protein n=1 Tax=Ancylostoma ceylanicum TaxID=53326 RepID=A0A016VH56_9BILA|nr:hypothetical protein Y032_0010g862 [Ancylostoma ceylanicum]
MKDRASRIADAAQTHAFAISWQPRVLFIEDLSSLTGLHRESAANECVRLFLLSDTNFLMVISFSTVWGCRGQEKYMIS